MRFRQAVLLRPTCGFPEGHEVEAILYDACTGEYYWYDASSDATHTFKA